MIRGITALDRPGPAEIEADAFHHDTYTRIYTSFRKHLGSDAPCDWALSFLSREISDCLKAGRLPFYFPTFEVESYVREFSEALDTIARIGPTQLALDDEFAPYGDEFVSHARRYNETLNEVLQAIARHRKVSKTLPKKTRKPDRRSTWHMTAVYFRGIIVENYKIIKEPIVVANSISDPVLLIVVDLLGICKLALSPETVRKALFGKTSKKRNPKTSPSEPHK